MLFAVGFRFRVLVVASFIIDSLKLLCVNVLFNVFVEDLGEFPKGVFLFALGVLEISKK
jgi:hypothetical protein